MIYRAKKSTDRPSRCEAEGGKEEKIGEETKNGSRGGCENRREPYCKIKHSHIKERKKERKRREGGEGKKKKLLIRLRLLANTPLPVRDRYPSIGRVHTAKTCNEQ